MRTGPYSWAHADHVVLVRYASGPELARLRTARPRVLHYVIDDLVTAAADSPELPEDYRARLARFSAETLPRILELSPRVVAPSQAILAAFPGLAGERLDPCCLAMVDGDMPRAADWGAPLRLAFLGTRSHQGSLPLLHAIASGLSRRLPDARLHLFFGRHLSPQIAASASIVNHAPIPWPRFAGFCRANRFHIALAPVQPTAFAQARSITKIMDHAAVGAVGIYSNRPPFAGVVRHGHDGLLVGDHADAWIEAICELVASPGRAAAMALAGARLAMARGAPEQQRRYWRQALALPPAGGGTA